MVSFPEDNWALKAELKQLRTVQTDLDSANKKVAAQKKQLERLPAAEIELRETRKRAEEAEARKPTLKARVDELSKAADRHQMQLAQVSIGGFKRAVEIVVVLEPETELKYFDGRHEAQEGKIYEGQKVVYDPEVDDAAEEEDEPEAQNNTPKPTGAEVNAAAGGSNNETAAS